MFIKSSEVFSNYTSRIKIIILSIIWMIICSKLTIYLYPVPITMQTFAVYMMSLFLTPEEAFLSMLGYLTLGSMGFPVFAGVFGFASMGYLIGMLVGAPFGSYLLSKGKSYTLSITGSCFFVYLFGCAWLSKYVGWSNVWQFGIAPFVLPAIFKMTAAISIKTAISKKL